MQATYDQLSREVLSAIPSILPSEFEDSPGGSTLEDQIQMYTNDVGDFLEIAARFKRGQIQEAADYIRSIDTAVRNNIPNTVIDYINRYAPPRNFY